MPRSARWNSNLERDRTRLPANRVFASVSGTNRLRGLAPTNPVTLWINCWRRGPGRRSNNAIKLAGTADHFDAVRRLFPTCRCAYHDLGLLPTLATTIQILQVLCAGGPAGRKSETVKTRATVEIRSASTFDVIGTVVGPADRRPCHMMILRSRRRRRVDGMAALHADRGRRRAGTPPAPPTWPRRVRLLALELW